MSQSRLPILTSGRLTLQLVPPLGGSIARFDYISPAGERIPCLCGVGGQEAGVLGQASFPLLPFCNRIRGGRFTFRGREIVLRPNLAGEPSPLHGQGWLSPWEVASVDAASAELVFRHPPDEWPWAYEARQHFALDETGLTLLLSCTNLSGEPMPCGLGQHPYFPCTPETRLDADVGSAWTIDETVLPVAKVPAEGRYSLRDRLVCGQDLDNGFGEWNGLARIGTPGLPFRIEISSPDAHFLHLYSPPAGGVFAAEPASHANAALNAPEEEWPALGLRVLARGETMALTMRIETVAVAGSERRP
ncbi:MAG: aldose 1-epimerase [Sphingomonadales bacterium]|jgi:aldose 1-epimerase|nr:aldose 1-epimerase [Sphingomonadales bacterium]